MEDLGALKSKSHATQIKSQTHLSPTWGFGVLGFWGFGESLAVRIFRKPPKLQTTIGGP